MLMHNFQPISTRSQPGIPVTPTAVAPAHYWNVLDHASWLACGQALVLAPRKSAPMAWNGLAKLINSFLVRLWLCFSLFVSRLFISRSLALSLFSSSLFSPSSSLQLSAWGYSLVLLYSKYLTLPPVIWLSLSLGILAANYNTTSLLGVWLLSSDCHASTSPFAF